MRFLLDQGLPRSAASLLCEVGHDTLHVGDIGAASASDRQILQLGREMQRVVVTLDADFHALLALSGVVTPSVIRIRIQELRAEALVTLLHTVLYRCQDDLTAGAAVTLDSARIRIRRLPIVGNHPD